MLTSRQVYLNVARETSCIIYGVYVSCVNLARISATLIVVIPDLFQTITENVVKISFTFDFFCRESTFSLVCTLNPHSHLFIS